MSILYGLDVKFPHQREIKGGRVLGSREIERARAAGRRPTSDISHWWPILQAAPNQPGSELDKNTFRPLADVSLRWVAKSSSSSSVIKKSRSFIQGGSHWPSIWLKEWRFTSNGERLKWSKSEVILWNLSSSANLRFSRRKSISWCVFLNSFTGEETKCRAGVKRRSHWDKKS